MNGHTIFFLGFKANNENAETYCNNDNRYTTKANSLGKKEISSENKIAKIVTFLSNFSFIIVAMFMALKFGINKLVFILYNPA